MKEFVEKRGVNVHLARFSDEMFSGLFSDEFIKRFDYDINGDVADYSFYDKWRDYYPKCDEKFVKYMMNGKTTDLLETDRASVQYFDIDYNVADKLKLYDVFDLNYFWFAIDDNLVYILDDLFCGFVFTQFLVISKNYLIGSIYLTLIPILHDDVEELQIRLTSGKF